MRLAARVCVCVSHSAAWGLQLSLPIGGLLSRIAASAGKSIFGYKVGRLISVCQPLFLNGDLPLRRGVTWMIWF